MSLGPLDHDLNQSIRKQLRILGYTEHTVEWDGAMAAARAYAERRDAPSARAISPQSASGASGVAEQGSAWAEALTGLSGRFEITSYDSAPLHLTCSRCGYSSEIDHPLDLAELVRRAGEHAEVCR